MPHFKAVLDEPLGCAKADVTTAISDGAMVHLSNDLANVRVNSQEPPGHRAGVA